MESREGEPSKSGNDAANPRDEAVASVLIPPNGVAGARHEGAEKFGPFRMSLAPVGGDGGGKKQVPKGQRSAFSGDSAH